ncbi:MAG: beta-galactosidase trimerization domain-containing protein [Kiritimatiellae bacterium]|nr:beta-galactosidase trimerization domain-containing protein [Kiritimatiellia bacterium]
MAYRPDAIGGGYTETLLRVEYRPRVRPHTKDELLEILDILQACGVDAWWYSVAAKGSYPLFPSKVLPYRKDVATDLYPWLVEEGHRRGIVMVSWEYLSTAPLLVAEHPDWQVEFLRGPERLADEPGPATMPCLLSPYGEMLKEYCVEVLNDLGFDAIWFDGSRLYTGAADGYRWTCCCERCARAFRDATGEPIPKRIDWADPVFRRFVLWRYDFFEDYWAALGAHVRDRCPKKLLAFNFFNRYYMGAVGGSPLRHRAIDQMIAGEGTALTVQMQTKVLRALNGRYPPEVWVHLLDGAKLGYPSRPNPDPAGNIFYAQAAATAGGYASFGIALHPRECAETLAEISAALRPLAGFVGGEPVRVCGLVFSGATKDFAWPATDGARTHAAKHKPAVDTVYGMGFLLNALHIPFEIVLDNQFDETLRQYPVLILPDVPCMQDEALDVLRRYVNDGGLLLVTGETGIKNPDGTEREAGLLDGLLGIRARSHALTHAILEPLAMPLLRRTGMSPPLPARYMVSGKARLVAVEQDVCVLARAERTPPGRRDRSPAPRAGAEPCDVAVCQRAVGKGRAVFIAPAIGSDYAQNPNRRSRELVRRLIADVPLPFTTDAPPNVVVTAWQQPGRLVLHLLNQPATLCRMAGFSSQISVEDVVPTGPIRVRVPGAGLKVTSPTTSGRVHVTHENGTTAVTVERLQTHTVLAFAGVATAHENASAPGTARLLGDEQEDGPHPGRARARQAFHATRGGVDRCLTLS